MSSLSFADVRLSYNPAGPQWRFRDAGLDAVVLSVSAARRKDPDGTKDGDSIAVPPTPPPTPPAVTPEPEAATPAPAVRPAKSGFKLGRLPRKPNASSV